jgi:hypothetical protein
LYLNMPEKAAIVSNNVVSIATGYGSMMAHIGVVSNAFGYAATRGTTQCAMKKALLSKE